MDENRVKDPLGQYRAFQEKAHPVEPMTGLGVFVRLAGLALLGLATIGLIAYGLLF